ncbi:pleckstrin homology domain-containing family J member 1 [Rhincodon typus]|uniref:pleckstrin homology domain-containing family J member 1 n=1 Tax=Rhincodon typus TaxID=259920 RepID=UPI00202F1ABB|nr:pleckstrin homology domain-containing family J member 1 [Rhincodon typus]
MGKNLEGGISYELMHLGRKNRGNEYFIIGERLQKAPEHWGLDVLIHEAQEVQKFISPFQKDPILLPAVFQAAKCRLVKLVVNFLFYFRIDEEEISNLSSIFFSDVQLWFIFLEFKRPVGALLLEQCRIQKEEDTGFSLVFVDEPERKYSFVCDNKDECEEWIEALTKASYEYMRNSLIFYRHEIEKITGKDPLEQYGISEEARFQTRSQRLF